MKIGQQPDVRRRQDGQTLIMFVFFIIVLLLFVGLGIDVGFAYITKAQLSKAVDAAALMGVRNLSQGDAAAIPIVQSTFAMNYGRPGRDTGVVTPTVNILTDSTSLTRQMKVSATATINTFFIRILPMWKTLTVSASAQALRARLILAVIADRSGSMANNQGWQKLPPALDHFIGLFDDTVDKAALVTFATTVRVDFPMGQPFIQQIKNATPRLQSQYVGATFAQGGLQAGYTQIINSPVQPNENVTRVAVFFTDGLANMIQETAPCPPSQILMFGGTDSPETQYAVMPATSDTSVTCWGTGPGPSCCSGFQQFASVNGGMKTVNTANLRQEGANRALAAALTMQNAGIIVYCIGLGSAPSVSFLRQVANDPASSTFDPNLPQGKALIAPTAQDLDNTFQTVGADILGRLTQ